VTRHVAEFEDRQAVFLQLQELGAGRCDRQAADRDVGIAFAVGGLGTDAGNVAEDLADRARAELVDLGFAQRAGRNRAVQPVAALGDAGREDLLACGGCTL
jgi:hypothetical protein